MENFNKPNAQQPVLSKTGRPKKKQHIHNHQRAKLVYPKKDKAQRAPEITQVEAAKEETSRQASAHYNETMRLIKKKGFFVDAEWGNRIFYNNILQMRVDKKDVPVLVAKCQFRVKTGELKSQNKVYRIVRYNDQQIVGMVTANIHYDVLPLVILQEDSPEN